MGATAKKYRVICKTENRWNRSAITRKWNVTDLKKFEKFLDEKFPTWTWFNVYDKETRVQVASYTKFDRPSTRKVPAGATIIRTVSVTNN